MDGTCLSLNLSPPAKHFTIGASSQMEELDFKAFLEGQKGGDQSLHSGKIFQRANAMLEKSLFQDPLAKLPWPTGVHRRPFLPKRLEWANPIMVRWFLK